MEKFVHAALSGCLVYVPSRFFYVNIHLNDARIAYLPLFMSLFERYFLGRGRVDFLQITYFVVDLQAEKYYIWNKFMTDIKETGHLAKPRVARGRRLDRDVDVLYESCIEVIDRRIKKDAPLPEPKERHKREPK